jgi:pimeloyl-ACP methyl ester carboxylesterase
MGKRRPGAAPVRLRRCLLAAIPLLCLALPLAGCVTPEGEEAAALLADIAAGAGPSRLKETTPAPARHTIRYRGAAGPEIADLYRSYRHLEGAVVVVPGLTPAGKDDPRLVAFALSLARARFLVLVPDIPGLRQLKVSAADSAWIAAAILEAARRFDGGRPRLADWGRRPVGLVAISYAVGPALLAAATPPAARRVGYAVAIGGYYDIEAALAYVTTGWYRLPDGTWRHRRPNAWGKWVFLRSNAGRVDAPADRALLRRIAARRLADPQAAIGDLAVRLAPEGRAVYALLVNRNPRLVPRLVAHLPAAIREELDRLDLKGRDLAAIQGPVFIIHGRDDRVIPYSESVELAKALGARAHLSLLDHFAHVGAGARSFTDSLALWRATTAILEERDRLAAAR